MTKLWTISIVALCIGSSSISVAQTVTVRPATGHPGQSTNASGASFGATEAVDIYFDTTDELLGVTDGSGAFGAYALTVPASALPGTHWITAIGRKTGDAAQKAFIVRTDWVEHGFSAHGKRFNPYENVLSTGNVGQLDIAWEGTTNGAVRSSPAVSGGNVYVGSLDGHLYAFNATTGATLWTATTGAAIESSPAVASGLVYVGSDDDKVYAFNATTGATVWTAGPIGSFFVSSPAVAGGLVYIGTKGGMLYAFNAATGATVWTAGPVPQIVSSPAVANGAVYFGTTADKLYAVNAGTGATLWTASTGGAVESSPAVANGAVYVGADDGRLWAFHAKTGTQMWAALPSGLGVLASPAVANGIVYVFTREGSLYALNATSGGTVWTTGWGLGGADVLSSSPAVADGLVYVGRDSMAEGAFSAVNAASGAEIWTAPLGCLANSPAVANGMIYVGCDDGNLYAFALNGGNNAAYKRDTQPPSFAMLHPDRRLKPLPGLRDDVISRR